MRGPLATTTDYRSPPPSRSVTAGKHGWGREVLPLPLWGRLREGPRRQPREHLKGRVSDTLG